MLNSDVLFRFRLRLFDHAREVGVSAACRTFGASGDPIGVQQHESGPRPISRGESQ